MHKLYLIVALFSIVCLQQTVNACGSEGRLSSLWSSVLSSELNHLAKALNKEKIHQVAKELVKLDRYKREASAENAEEKSKHVPTQVALEDAVISVARLIDSAMNSMEPTQIGRSTAQIPAAKNLKDHVVRSGRSPTVQIQTADATARINAAEPVNTAGISSAENQ